MHNLINAMFFKFSGNDLHEYMDRFAKKYRGKHREVGGHDTKALMEMLLLFRHKYTPIQIMKTFYLHRLMDGSFSGLQAGIRKSIKGYGKKDSALEVIEKLKKEVFRL